MVQFCGLIYCGHVYSRMTAWSRWGWRTDYFLYSGVMIRRKWSQRKWRRDDRNTYRINWRWCPSSTLRLRWVYLIVLFVEYRLLLIKWWEISLLVLKLASKPEKIGEKYFNYYCEEMKFHSSKKQHLWKDNSMFDILIIRLTTVETYLISYDILCPQGDQVI